MRKTNKRGSEKPIEIFVALFLILAVAMVLLRMFSGQVADASADLGQFQDSQRALATCQSVCNDAKQNNCRDIDKVRYCSTYFSLDLNEDSEIGIFRDAGILFCEDRIHCPIIDNCVCGQQLSMENCRRIVENYFTELNQSPSVDLNVNDIMLDRFQFTNGACPSVQQIIDDPNEVLPTWIQAFGYPFN